MNSGEYEGRDGIYDGLTAVAEDLQATSTEGCKNVESGKLHFYPVLTLGLGVR